jgi:DNA-binding CsgD family transcriptional regulator
MMVYHQGEHVAWIGLARMHGDPTFTRADVRRAAPLADSMADALIAAQARERAASEGACDVLITPAGRVEYASSRGRDWVRSPAVRDALRVWARSTDRGRAGAPRFVDGHAIRWSRLVGQGQVRYLLHLEPVVPVRLAPTYPLSKTQREVAQLAAAGARAAEIGQMMHLATSTVRSHLRLIYRRLEITSRAELAHVLASE